ncbi:hypothetical protein CEQ90_19925 [Lewinellaceae bacterium SD302]|nr:hypothetical protein CEQ90_19925 [Lewinellaceae bacterium SD302]
MKVIIGIQSIIIVGLLMFIAYDKGVFNSEKSYEEMSISELESLLNGKTSIYDMSPKEWTIQNYITIKKSDSTGIKIDTFDYDEAIVQHEKLFENIEREILSQNCSQEIFFDQFNEMMAFNKPFLKYDKRNLQFQEIDQCTYRIAVTTREGEYNMKTFWVWEITYDSTDKQYSMKPVQREFLG